MLSSFACSICNEPGHRAIKCKGLYSDLKKGFYEGQRIQDDDDDHDHDHYAYLRITMTSGNFKEHDSSHSQGSRAGH